jgi:hypothetical protein
VSRSAMRWFRSSMSRASSRMQRAAVRCVRLSPRLMCFSLRSSRLRSQRMVPASATGQAASSLSAAVALLDRPCPWQAPSAG